jgi:hypothetical protein
VFSPACVFHADEFQAGDIATVEATTSEARDVYVVVVCYGGDNCIVCDRDSISDKVP